MDIYKRIVQLCETSQTTMADLERQFGWSRSTINSWKNGGNINAKKLISLANFFNVSVDYLLGKTDVRTPVDEIVEDEVLSRCLKLSDIQKKEVDKIISVALDIISRKD